MTQPTPPLPVTWVVGASGLLGGQVLRRLRAVGGRSHVVPIDWSDPARTRNSLHQGFLDFRREVGAAPWAIAWCAGNGVVSTPSDRLDQELETFSQFVDDLTQDLRRCGPTRADGSLFLASSAGGVYAGSSAPPFTEATTPRPISPYGHAKLGMEEAALAWSKRTGLPVLIARIANLYGPGQRLDKPQGLVSQLCRAHLTGQPLRLYVSLDTRRDYLFVADCAAMVVDGIAGLRDRASHGDEVPAVTKIFASGQGTTVATLIGETTRLFRRRPPLSLASRAESRGQILDLRFRSTVWPELDKHVRTPLPVGIAATRDDLLLWRTRPRTTRS